MSLNNVPTHITVVIATTRNELSILKVGLKVNNLLKQKLRSQRL
jgi:hypothetical protein